MSDIATINIDGEIYNVPYEVAEKIRRLEIENDNHQWKDVTKELPKRSKKGHPKQSDYVLLLTYRKNIIEAYYDYFYLKWYAAESGYKVKGTHWMPIVKLP